MPTARTVLQGYRETAQQIVCDVFDTMLGATAHPLDGSEVEQVEHPLVSTVQFAGEWNGTLFFECGATQAFALTAHLMSVAEPCEINEDVRDSMGEITNMMAGNLKTLLPSSTELSAPFVIEGTEFMLRVLGDNEVLRLLFSSPFGPFAVTLVHVMRSPTP